MPIVWHFNQRLEDHLHSVFQNTGNVFIAALGFKGPCHLCDSDFIAWMQFLLIPLYIPVPQHIPPYILKQEGRYNLLSMDPILEILSLNERIKSL